MKKVLVIGSTVADVVISVERLPKTGEDVHVKSQSMTLGGCAYNVSDAIRHFHVPYILFSPAGTGAYGDFVRNALCQKGVPDPIYVPDTMSGCCYCFIEDSGERTFVCHRGAEYHFRPEWFAALDSDSIDCVYICGLEMEESDNTHIIDFLETHPEYTVYFAPGPRINILPPERMNRLFALSPVLHLNETEALTFTKQPTIEKAAESLYQATKNTVIITLGEKGAYYKDDSTDELIPSINATQINTVGAGDSHIGTVISCLKRGDSMKDSISKANRYSAAIVEQNSAQLSDEIFEQLQLI